MNVVSVLTIASAAFLFVVLVAAIGAYFWLRRVGLKAIAEAAAQKAKKDADAEERRKKWERDAKEKQQRDEVARLEAKARQEKELAEWRRKAIETSREQARGCNRSVWFHGGTVNFAGVTMYYDKNTDDLVESREQLTAAPTDASK
jgi:hypothetical protein